MLFKYLRDLHSHFLCQLSALIKAFFHSYLQGTYVHAQIDLFACYSKFQISKRPMHAIEISKGTFFMQIANFFLGKNYYYLT